MNIVYVSDDGYSPIMGVSIASLLENNTDAKSIVINILENDISRDNRQKLTAMVERYGRTIRFFSLNEIISRLGQNNVVVERGSLMQLGRLFFDRFIDADRLLYLDCDTLILDSLGELYESDMKGKPLAMSRDIMPMHHLKRLGFSTNAEYFNSGVMLIDSAVWKEQRWSEKILSYIEKNPVISFPYVDQDIINVMMGRFIQCLDVRFNCIAPFYEMGYKTCCEMWGITADFPEKLQSPVIIHYTHCSFGRPWQKSCRLATASLWLKYQAISPWKDSPLQSDRRSRTSKAQYLLWRLMPEKCYVFGNRILAKRVLERTQYEKRVSAD